MQVAEDECRYPRPYYSIATIEILDKAVEDLKAKSRVSRLEAIRFMQDRLNELEINTILPKAEMKVGQRVAIYQNPKEEKDFEGYAVLEHYTGTFQKISKDREIQLWDVRFESDDRTVCRWKLVGGKVTEPIPSGRR